MNQAGEIWACFLEKLASKSEEEAFNELMRLSNCVSRVSPPSDVLLELNKEAEKRFHLHLRDESASLSKKSIGHLRNGHVEFYEEDFHRLVLLLRFKVALDLVSKNPVSTPTDCREPLKQTMLVHMAVVCTKTRDDLKKKLDWLKQQQVAGAKNTNLEDLGFVDAVETCVSLVLHNLSFCDQSQSLFEEAFLLQFRQQIREVPVGQIKSIVNWFLDVRLVHTVWKQRTLELGGLTLPKALHQQSTVVVSETKSLNDEESSTLDLILDELSELLSLFDTLGNPTLTEEFSIVLSSDMVNLDELWVTHNISKAVSHSESITSEGLSVNSIVEDTFHVVNTSVSRAMHSRSKFAQEAIANHVGGFIADGFFEILSQLVQHKDPLSLHVEAINTLGSSILFSQSLLQEVQSLTMASQLLEEGIARMTALQEKILHELCANTLLSKSALVCISRSLAPEQKRYVVPSSAPEDWISPFVAAQFRDNAVFMECFHGLSPVTVKPCVEHLVLLCTQFIEEKLNALTFTALGALLLDCDIRTCCDHMVETVAELQREDVSFELLPYFARLRHFSFLLNLETKRDALTMPFPANVLDSHQVECVLQKRVEPEFFL